MVRFIAAGLLTAMAIATVMLLGGLGSTDRVSACDTLASWSGVVSSGKTEVHTATLCSDPDTDLLVALNWKSAKRDLRLVVTDPNGESTVVDGHAPQSYEVFARQAPLPEGDWTITVEYDGKGKVAYSLWARFD